MAWRYQISATCDQCGKSVVPPNIKGDSLTTLSGLQTIRHCIISQWKREGTVMLGLTNLAGKQKMYCRECAGS